MSVFLPDGRATGLSGVRDPITNFSRGLPNFRGYKITTNRGWHPSFLMTSEFDCPVMYDMTYSTENPRPQGAFVLLARSFSTARNFLSGLPNSLITHNFFFFFFFR